MSSLPKPQPCGQNWLAMSPTEKGRICGQCEKIIYDFSRSSWAEIAQQQQTHGNSLCGMYSDAQLQHWGQQPSTGACAKLAAATTLALSLSAAFAPAQTPVKNAAAKLVLRGSVFDCSPSAGQPTPIPGVTVLLRGTQVGISTDTHGQYELSIPDSVDTKTHSIVVFSSIGYVSNEFALPADRRNLEVPILYDAQLVPNNKNLDIFYVAKPTLATRIKWTLHRWFSRDK